MELYIEKEFLDNFFASYDYNKPSQEQEIIKNILTEYEEIEWYYDQIIDTPEELALLKQENPFFALRCNHKTPIETEDFKNQFFLKSNCQQTLILTNESKDWFDSAQGRGAICLSFNNYEKRIKEIIERCHFKVDLSLPFLGWNLFQNFQILPLNFITINDSYIFTDKTNQKMDKNIIQMLKYFLNNRTEEVYIKILTKDFNPPQATNDKLIIESAYKRHQRLNSALANYSKKLLTVNNEHSRNFELHDRIITTNFLMIDSGKGFNLIPHKPSNSQIVVETIFNRYTYKRMRNHQKKQKEYLHKLSKLNTIKFKSIPELN